MRKTNNKNNKKVSSTEKKGDLLIQVDDLMNQLENDYGPLMLDELKKRLHKTIEGVVIDGENSHLENEILPEFFKSFISIVPETNVWVNNHTRGVTFPTEKTEKCFTAGQPFIAVSTPGYLRQLRSLGFRTFDGFINEDYDSFYNDEERHERIMSLVHDISTWSLEKCERIYKEMIPILKHNQEVNKKYLKLQNSAGFSFIDDIIQDEVYEDMLIKAEDKQRYNPDRLI